MQGITKVGAHHLVTTYAQESRLAEPGLHHLTAHLHTQATATRCDPNRTWPENVPEPSWHNANKRLSRCHDTGCIRAQNLCSVSLRLGDHIQGVMQRDVFGEHNDAFQPCL